MFPISALLLASAAQPVPIESPERPGFDLSIPATLAEDPPPALNEWKGSVSLGATFADGNSKRKTATATANAEYRREKDRTTLGLLWNYAQESGTTTQRRTLVTGKYDYFLTQTTYLLANASAEHDLSAQLKLRTIVGVGAGYQVLEDERWNVSAEAGLSYVDEDYKDNSADGDYLAARLAYKADVKLSEKWSAGQATEFLSSLENSEDMNARVDTHTKVTLTANMFAQGQWLYTWDNTPAAGAHHSDNLWLLTVGWSF